MWNIVFFLMQLAKIRNVSGIVNNTEIDWTKWGTLIAVTALLLMLLGFFGTTTLPQLINEIFVKENLDISSTYYFNVPYKYAFFYDNSSTLVMMRSFSQKRKTGYLEYMDPIKLDLRNKGYRNIVIDKIDYNLIEYSPPPSRYIILAMPKGIFERKMYKIVLSPNMKSVPILENEYIKLSSNDYESISIDFLDGVPGYYRFKFKIEYSYGTEKRTVYTPEYCLFIPGDENYLVISEDEFSISLIEWLLNMPEIIWNESYLNTIQKEDTFSQADIESNGNWYDSPYYRIDKEFPRLILVTRWNQDFDVLLGSYDIMLLNENDKTLKSFEFEGNVPPLLMSASFPEDLAPGQMASIMKIKLIDLFKYNNNGSSVITYGNHSMKVVPFEEFEIDTEITEEEFHTKLNEITEEEFRKLNILKTEKMLSIDPHLSFILAFEISGDSTKYRVKFEEGVPISFDKKIDISSN